MNRTDPKGLFWLINGLLCPIYKTICAYKATECSEKIQEKQCTEAPGEDENYWDEIFPSNKIFTECWFRTPECQKALEYCGEFSLDIKDPFWDILKLLKKGL